MRPHDHRWRAAIAALVLVASTVMPVLASSPASATGTSNLQGWGFNYYGYLGDGSNNNATAPEALNQSYVTQVSAGSGVLALHNDGTVTAWGRNGEGQLGDGGTSYRELSPVQVKLPPVVQVSEGATSNDFGLALDGAGNVYSFGRNAEAELGRNTGGGADPTPVLVSGLPTTITAISAGGMHSLARTSDGHVWAWGWNQFGQLGDSTKYATTYNTFQVPNLSNIASVVAGGNDSYALDTSGHVWAWGWDYGGQGVAPSQVAGLPAIQQLSAGNDHALGLDANGHVWAWGSNQYGQVGDNGPTGWCNPVQLTGLTGVTSVSAASTDSFAIESDGSLWAWGSNWFSQLGDGTTTQQNLPEHITGVSNVGGVSSNGFATLAWGIPPVSSASIGTISAAVTPDSPLYAMKVSVGLSGVTCPASVAVTVAATITRFKPLCSTGGTAPTSTTLIVGVLSLNPSTTYSVTAFANDANGVTPTGTGSLTTPKVPVWVADGDSVSSGHHQDQDEPCNFNGIQDQNSFQYAAAEHTLYGSWSGTCLDPKGSGAMSYTPNDSTFAWATRAHDQLMSQLSVPSQWRMDILVLARSGALAQNYNQPGPQNDDACNGCGEKDDTVTALQAHAGSWNIVSVTGGANDANFGDRLSDFYHNSQGQGKPWDVTYRSDCPNLDQLESDIQNTSSSVQTALTQLFADAQTADPNVRRVAVTYPHVLNATATCAPDSAGIAPYTGATHAIDDLDGAITALSSTGVMVVDLRTTGFSSNPQDDIQLTRYFGYPHPNSAGQNAIASAVVGRLLS